MTTSIGTFTPGRTIRIRGRFTDVNGALVDPVAGTLTLTPPDDGTPIPIAFGAWVRESLGVFHVTFAIPAAESSVGIWLLEWDATDGVIAAEPALFVVEGSALYPPEPPPAQFATAFDLATLLGLDTSTLTDDWIAQANLLLQLISADIESAAGAPIEAGTGTILLSGTWSRDLELPVGPIRSITSVSINGVELDPSLYWWNDRSIIRRGVDALTQNDPDDEPAGHNGGATSRAGLNWTGPISTVRITLSWGFVAIPQVLRGLTLRVAARTIGNVADVTQESLAIYSATYGSSTAKNGSYVSEPERIRLRRMLNRTGGTFTTAGR